MTEVSALQKARYSYQPKLPAVLKNDLDKIAIKFGKATESVAPSSSGKAPQPYKVLRPWKPSRL